MFPSSEARFAVPALHRRRRGAYCAGWFVVLGIGGVVIPTWPCRAEEPPSLTVVQAATSPVIDKPAVPSLGGAPVVVATSPAPSDDQRRMLLLLLMNSAGSVRPFAGLGR